MVPLWGGEVFVGHLLTWERRTTNNLVSITRKIRQQLFDGVTHGSFGFVFQSLEPWLMKVLSGMSVGWIMFLTVQSFDQRCFHSLAMLLERVFEEIIIILKFICYLQKDHCQSYSDCHRMYHTQHYKHHYILLYNIQHCIHFLLYFLVSQYWALYLFIDHTY